MDLGVKALGTNPRRSDKQDRGESGIPLEFGGVQFRPGEFLYSDKDGILLSGQALF